MGQGRERREARHLRQMGKFAGSQNLVGTAIIEPATGKNVRFQEMTQHK